MKASTVLKWAYKQLVRHGTECMCEDCKSAHAMIESVITTLKKLEQLV